MFKNGHNLFLNKNSNKSLLDNLTLKLYNRLIHSNFKITVKWIIVNIKFGILNAC